MSVNSFLVNHALRNVWCAPRRDTQNLYIPARICGKEGAWNKMKVGWNTYRLPTQRERYYVYQIGNISPDLLGLTYCKETWVNLADVCAVENVMVDLFNVNGIQYPRYTSWYMVTADNNLVLAIKEQKKIGIALNAEALYVRFYSNNYFSKSRASTLDVPGITVKGAKPQNNAEILAFQHLYEDYKSRPGYVWCFKNGYAVDSLTLVNVQPADIVEFVYDSTVKRVVDYPLSSLPSFDSQLDGVRKYLLHYAGDDDGMIDFHDDIDFFVVKPGVGTAFSGVYYHRAKVNFARMVTHRDYAIPVPQVVALANAQGWVDPNSLRIRAIIRNGDYGRQLVNENNRIKELYKLPDALILEAMLGLNASVPNWRAETLEASAYTAIMRQSLMRLDQAMVEDAYGYNAIASLVGQTPKLVQVSGVTEVVDVAYGLQKNSTALEYDANGVLLGTFAHLLGGVYTTRMADAVLVEQLMGLASDSLEEVYGESVVQLDPTTDYRMYVCPIVDGVPTNKWQDVTGSQQYVVQNNTLTWLIDSTRWYTLVRGNSIMLGYDFTASHTNGVLSFTLKHRVVRNGITAYQAMQIPMATMRLYMNGKQLIRGLDYHLDFPRVVVVNKDYLKDPSKYSQSFTVMAMGFCGADLKMEPPAEFGYVVHGALSRNNHYDLRDDKVQHIVVDGATYDKSELVFAETDSTVRVTDAKNGKPYLVEDVIVPFRDMTLERMDTARAASQAIDKAIGDYLTLKLPQTSITAPSAIDALYRVYSPFVARLIYACNNGYIKDTRLFDHYSAELVMELCQPYEWLLKFEPTYPERRADDNYVVVEPHPLNTVINLNVYYYKFITMAIAHYLENRVTLSGYANVTT